MTDDEYIRRELSKARPTSPNDTVCIKARSDAGESRWITLSREAYERMINALAGE